MDWHWPLLNTAPVADEFQAQLQSKGMIQKMKYWGDSKSNKFKNLFLNTWYEAIKLWFILTDTVENQALFLFPKTWVLRSKKPKGYTPLSLQNQSNDYKLGPMSPMTY